MEKFVKFADSEGTEIYLTRKEVEQVNKRLEFSHTTKVFGANASRPLYLMPGEFERGVRRYKHFANEKGRLLDIGKFLKLDSRLRALRKRSELVLIILLTGCVGGLWYLGGGKTPPFAYAVFDTLGGSISKFLMPAAIAFVAIGVLVFAFIKKRLGGFEVHED